MDILDKLIQEWSWRTEKGYPDLTNKDDLKILREVFGINLAEGLKEKEAVRKIIAADPGKYEKMSNDFRIANKAKVSAEEFIESIKKAFGDDTSVEMLPPRTGKNESGKFNLFTFDADGKEVSIYLAGGASANEGIKYELQVAQDLHNYNKGETDFMHKDVVEEIIQEFGLKPGNFEIKEEGKENKRRPLKFTPEGPIIDYSGESVADTLTDLTIIKGSEKFYISLKFGSTLTFFNAGVAVNTFPAEEIKTGKVTNPNGIALLEMLGIDNELFCRVFNEYEKTDFKQYHTTTSDFDQKKLFNLVHSGIGSGYYMLKGAKGGYSFYKVTEEYAMKAATPTSGINIQYGGSNGLGKRIDVVFESAEYYFKINIRNKQGGLYPSHIMCDYKKK